MNLRQIEVFRAVMLGGSISEAARMLHVSQPGISRMIRHLELQLGVLLFERQPVGLVPTPEARVLQAQIETVYRGVRHVQQVAERLRDGSGQALRLLASPSIGLELVPKAISALVAEQPEARLSFESMPTRDIATRLMHQDTDLVFSSAALDDPVFNAQVIGQWSLLAAFPALSGGSRRGRASSAHPLSAFKGQRLVNFSAEAPQRAAIDAILAAHGIDAAASIEVRSGYAACALVAHGAAVAIVDSLSARAFAQAPIRFVRLHDAPLFPVFAVHHRRAPLSRTGHLMVQKVSDLLARLPAH